MCPLDDFGRAYIGETGRHKRPLNALKFAIERYIEIRQNWIDNSSALLGWRGAFSQGKLFFNRGKTKRNIAIMQQIIGVIDNQSEPYHSKLEEIKSLKGRLTSGGQARQLIEIFEQTAISEDSAYFSARESSLEQSIYIKKDTAYQRRKVLGSGACGKVSQFASKDGSKRVVVKDMHGGIGDGVPRFMLENEVAIFAEVYELLGAPLFGFDKDSRILRYKADRYMPSAKILLPEVPGQSMSSFVKSGVTFDEDSLFYSMFDFMEKMHKRLNIAHRDCHSANIMVIDNFCNVFFIDFGFGYKYNDPTGEDRNKKGEFFAGIRKDLVYAVYNIFCVHSAIGRDENISLRILIERYNLRRWDGWGFRSGSRNSYSLESVLLSQVNPKLQAAGFRGRLTG